MVDMRCLGSSGRSGRFYNSFNKVILKSFDVCELGSSLIIPSACTREHSPSLQPHFNKNNMEPFHWHYQPCCTWTPQLRLSWNQTGSVNETRNEVTSYKQFRIGKSSVISFQHYKWIVHYRLHSNYSLAYIDWSCSNMLILLPSISAQVSSHLARAHSPSKEHNHDHCEHRMDRWGVSPWDFKLQMNFLSCWPQACPPSMLNL